MSNESNENLISFTNDESINLITCPKCGFKFKLSDSILSDLENNLKKNFELKEIELKNKLEKKAYIEKEKFIADIEEETSKKLKANFDLKYEFLKKQSEDTNKKYLESQTKIQELLREITFNRQAIEEEKVRLLEEYSKDKKNLENKIQTKIEAENRLKDLEKEKIIQDQKNKLAEMSRKLNQHSQQLQGETMELDITSMLQSKFLQDKILEVPKGTQGVDIIQIVRNDRLQECGKLAIEIKNTKSFAKRFIDKIKHDRLEARADIAVIIATTLPNDMEYFGIIDDVIIVHYNIYMGVIEMLRNNLINMYSIKASNINRIEKKDILFNYITEPGFFDKIKSMYNAYADMKSDLDLEKNSVRRSWNRRERKLEDIVDNINSVWAELSAITGLFQEQISY